MNPVTIHKNYVRKGIYKISVHLCSKYKSFTISAKLVNQDQAKSIWTLQTAEYCRCDIHWDTNTIIVWQKNPFTCKFQGLKFYILSTHLDIQHAIACLLMYITYAWYLILERLTSNIMWCITQSNQKHNTF